jgi:hypothetical protein
MHHLFTTVVTTTVDATIAVKQSSIEETRLLHQSEKVNIVYLT